MNLAFLKPYVPDFILKARQRVLKKRLQVKLRQDIERRDQAKKLSLSEFQQMLRDLGIRRGDCLLVHSGIGTFNPVDGGASAILKSLEDAVGPEGNLIFPAFPDWWKTVQERTPFDQKNTATTMGTLAEMVRRRPGVKRSLHPTHSVCAMGPKANWIVGGHEQSPYAFGGTSPYYKACMLNAKIVAIGLSMNSISSIHVSEELLIPNLWFPVHEPEMLDFEMIPEDGPRFQYRSAVLRSPKNRDCERLRPALIKNAAIHSIRTDYAEIFALDSRGLVLTSLQELLNEWSVYGRLPISSEQRQHVQALLFKLQQEFTAAGVSHP